MTGEKNKKIKQWTNGFHRFDKTELGKNSRHFNNVSTTSHCSQYLKSFNQLNWGKIITKPQVSAMELADPSHLYNPTTQYSACAI